MVTIAKYIPATEESQFNDYCDGNYWHDPKCPWCRNNMEVCGLRCTICKGEWRDGEMTKGTSRIEDKK
jgi:hypothetical protein